MTTPLDHQDPDEHPPRCHCGELLVREETYQTRVSYAWVCPRGCDREDDE